MSDTSASSIPAPQPEAAPNRFRDLLRFEKMLTPRLAKLGFYVLSALAIFLAAPPVLAQHTLPGSGAVGFEGSLSAATMGGNFYGRDGRTVGVLFAPSASYFATADVAIGASLLFARSNTTKFQEPGTTLGLGTSFAVYFGASDEELAPFMGFSLLGLRTRTTDTERLIPETLTFYGAGFDLNGGVTYMLAPNLGITGEAFLLVKVLTQFAGAGETDVGNAIGLRVSVTGFL